jgi:hypothetical protein
MCVPTKFEFFLAGFEVIYPHFCEFRGFEISKFALAV